MNASNPKQTTVRYAAFTHQGKPFPHNQDAMLVAGRVVQKAEFIDGWAPLAQMPRFAISDGVSGNPQPAAASRLLLQALLALESTHPGLSPQARAELLQDRLMRALNRERRLEDAAATLITVERAGAALRLWHAGDSRGYRITQGQARRLTQDHTAVNVLRAEGSLSAEDEDALGESGLANALDNIFVYSHYAEPPTVSVQSLQLPPGEVLLLVSDGVTAELSDTEIAACLNAADLPGSAQRLFAAVMAKGAGDDFSAILLALDPAAT
jgi:serine/threonine protein phosphatase PrpC